VRITHTDDLASGIDRLLPLLSKRSVFYGQLIGILVRIRRSPATFGEEKPRLWLIENTKGELMGGACRTPPHPLQFSLMDDEILRALAIKVAEDDPSCPGVIGPTPQVVTLARAMEPTEGAAKARLTMTLYGLTHLRLKPQGTLTYRKAELDDFDLVSQWMYRFAIDCNLPDGPMPEERLRCELAEGRIDLAFTYDKEPVLMFKAVSLGETRTLRLGAVYTPDQCRGRGYATEGLAKVIDEMLGSEVDAVTLFADKNNPVSNRMYLKLGFEEVADINMMNWAPIR